MPTKKSQRERFFDFWNRRFEGITFDDVLLEPRRSRIVPRDVCLDTFLTSRIQLHTPLVSADMDTVTEAKFAIKIAMEGGLGFLWKHPDIDEQVGWAYSTKYAFNKLIDKPVTTLDTQTKRGVRETLLKYGNRFSSLVVLNSGGKVIGLVTRDQTRFAKDSDLVRDFMVREPVKTSKVMSAGEAYDFMTKSKTGKLIIIKRDGTLRGMYTFKDVAEIVEGATPMYNRDSEGRLRVGANVGVFDKSDNKSRDKFMERAGKLLEARCDALLVGTAHGDSENVINSVRTLRREFKNYDYGLVAGNVATYSGAVDLINAGADAIKIGIGAGAICTTRIVAGIGVPQLTAVYDCARAARKRGKRAIADGGIRFSGDIVKALAAGADCAMAGGLFAATEESAGQIVVGKGGARFKLYRGMGSVGAMTQNQSADRYSQKGAEKLVPEGVETRVPLKGSASEVIYQLVGGIRSGMGYLGARTIPRLRERARFIRISAAGHVESHPHDVEIIEEAPNYRR
ncbi:MAG: IMP dehydrogenase [Nanoarchaeota archaeon]|nr:IMP dehydrogenase [Nanoarchaeota archaeon]MBU4086797.1 IMP dehydrogenase [Nanoarchaeota archaeon]